MVKTKSTQNTFQTRLQRVLPAVVVLIAILLLWEVITRAAGVPSYVLPAPSRVFRALLTDRAALLRHSRVTLFETITGLILATIIGILLAVIMDLSGLARRAIWPLLVITQSVPVIALAPIFMIYLGFGIAPKILTVVLMCFFPIAVSFTEGLNSVHPAGQALLTSFGASRLQLYTFSRIPAAVSSLFSGLRVAATYSMSGALVGEWLSAEEGLGYYMLRVNNAFQLDRVFASIIVVIIWGLLLNFSVALIRALIEPGTGLIWKLRRIYRQKQHLS